MGGEIVKLALAQGVEVESSDADWHDKLAVNFLAVAEPVLDARGYMHTFPAIVEQLIAPNTTRCVGAVYDTDANAFFTLEIGTDGFLIFSRIVRDVYYHFSQGVHLSPDNGLQYYPMAISPYSIAFIDGTQRLTFFNKKNPTRLLDQYFDHRFTYLNNYQDSGNEAGTKTNKQTWRPNLYRSTTNPVAASYIFIPSLNWVAGNGNMFLSFQVMIKDKGNIKRWILASSVSNTRYTDPESTLLFGIYIGITNNVARIMLRTNGTDADVVIPDTPVILYGQINQINIVIPEASIVAILGTFKQIGLGFSSDETFHSLRYFSSVEKNTTLDHYYSLYNYGPTVPTSANVINDDNLNSEAVISLTSPIPPMESGDFWIKGEAHGNTPIPVSTDWYWKLKRLVNAESRGEITGFNQDTAGQTDPYNSTNNTTVTLDFYLGTNDTSHAAARWIYLPQTIIGLPLNMSFSTFINHSGIWILGTHIFYKLTDDAVPVQVPNITLTVGAWNHVSFKITHSTAFQSTPMGAYPYFLANFDVSDSIRHFSIHDDLMPDDEGYRRENHIEFNLFLSHINRPSPFVYIDFERVTPPPLYDQIPLVFENFTNASILTNERDSYIYTDELWDQSPVPYTSSSSSGMMQPDYSDGAIANVKDVIYFQNRFIFIIDGESGFRFTDIDQRNPVLAEQRTPPNTATTFITLTGTNQSATAIRNWNDYVMIFTRHTLEFFRATPRLIPSDPLAAPSSVDPSSLIAQVYAPEQSLRLQIGALSPSCICRFDDTFVLLGGPPNKPPAIYKIVQGGYQELSTRRIEQYIRQYNFFDLERTYLEPFKFDGHNGFFVHFYHTDQTQRVTLAYDENFKESPWHIVSSGQTSVADYQAIHHIYIENFNAIDNWRAFSKYGNKIYRLTYDSAAQDGHDVFCQLHTQMIQARNKTAFDLEFDKVSNDNMVKSFTVEVTYDGINYKPPITVKYNDPQDLTGRVLLHKIGYIRNNIGFRLSFVTSSPLSLSNARIRLK